jgi:photosystem II stability/assembly factor-like uncharacterized protein
MTESAANRPFFWIGIIILLLLSAGLVQAQLVTSIGNQEALSSFGSATNSINISESEGSPMRVVSPPAPPAQGDVGWITGFPADGYGVILHTTDGGENWTRQGSPNTIPNVELTDVRAIDAYSAWAVGGNDNHCGVILRTVDGGKTWIRCGAPGSVPDFTSEGIGAVDSKIAWVVGGNGTIIHTEDGGKTWVRQASNTNAPLYRVAVVDRCNAWIIGNVDNIGTVVLRTSDGGLTWTRQGNASTFRAVPLIDVTAADNKTAWAVGHDITIFKTMDGGASWQIQMAKSILDMNGVCAIDKYNAWAARDYGLVYWTSDGGKTWNEQNPNGTRFWLLSVSARTLKTAWVVGASPSGQGGIILHTTNRGVNWTEQFAPINVFFERVSFVGSKA